MVAHRWRWLHPVFQFHKGTIKTGVLPVGGGGSSDFNSIKVRLKQAPRRMLTFYTQFQFHKGTIKTIRIVNDILVIEDFNSIKVRLKRYRLSIRQ